MGWKAYIMNLGFYILFLVLLTTMTLLLEDDNKQQHDALLDIPRFTIVVMSLFHLLKEIFQIWDEVRLWDRHAKRNKSARRLGRGSILVLRRPLPLPDEREVHVKELPSPYVGWGIGRERAGSRLRPRLNYQNISKRPEIKIEFLWYTGWRLTMAGKCYLLHTKVVDEWQLSSTNRVLELENFICS